MILFVFLINNIDTKPVPKLKIMKNIVQRQMQKKSRAGCGKQKKILKKQNPYRM